MSGGVETQFKARHGRAGTKAGSYGVWLCMKQRCNYVKHKSFKDYGGRGIKICERWRTYENFHEDMGDPPFKGATLGRIDNSGDYAPENCRWESQIQQNRNRRSNRLLTAWGETLCVTAWAEKFQIRRDTLAWRLSHGWSLEAALKTPALKARTV